MSDEQLAAIHGRPWTVQSVERVHDNPWFAVDSFAATAPTGAPARYYAQAYKNVAVGVLPLHDDGSVTLVGQWRFPFAAYSWELPEGGAPPAEDPLAGAQRELREEAGLEASQWREMLRMQLSNASSDEVAVLYLATGLTEVPRALDATEELAILRLPVRQALAAAVDGRIQDSLTVAALLRLHHMAVEGEVDLSVVKFVLPSLRRSA